MSISRFFDFLHHRRVLIQTAFVVVVTAVYFWMFQDQTDWVNKIEHIVTQWRMELWPPRPAPKDVVILTINDSTFTANKSGLISPEKLAAVPELKYLTSSWPWDRTLWARLTERLIGAGARFVAYDLVFKDTSNPEGDAECGRVFAKFSDSTQPGHEQVAVAALLGDSTYPGSNAVFTLPEPALTANTGPDIVGLIKLNSDDGLVRTIQHHWNFEMLEVLDRVHNQGAKPKIYPTYSLSWVVAKKVLGAPPKREGDTPMIINYYGAADTIETLKLEEVLLNWDKYKEYFKNKVVFVGTDSETRFSDTFDLYGGYITGVEIQATAYANLVNEEWFENASDFVILILTVVLGALALVVSLYMRSVAVKMVLFASLGAFFLVGTQLLYSSHLILVPVLGAAFILVGTGVFGTLYDYVLGAYERQRMLGMFESMVSPGVAGLLLSHRGDFEKRLGGQRQDVVVLFGDIRNFTTWSEKVGPDALVAQLNEHLTSMVSIVQEEGGTVQKYIGDALMVAWGDVRAQPPAEGAEHAVRAALRMQASMHKLNEGWKGQAGREQLAFGIGINHGEGVVGLIGHPRRMEFNVMGDPVNLAARLESATKQFNQPILVGESVYEMTKEIFAYRLVDKIRVKGKSRATRVYAPLGELRDVHPPGLPTYELAIEKYYNRDFAGAEALFQSAKVEMGGVDFLCDNFIERCLYYRQVPPPPDWDGSWTLKEK